MTASTPPAPTEPPAPEGFNLGEYLARGYGDEHPDIEFKCAGSATDKPFLAKVIRAVLALSNRRDGGHLIVGVTSDANKQPQVDGLTPEQLASWTKDGLGGNLREYADPPPEFHLRHVTEEPGGTGGSVVYVRAMQFSEGPTLCKKEYTAAGKKAPTLRKGALYIRPRGGVTASREAETVEEMRELLDLALDVRLAKFHGRLRLLGASLGDAPERTEWDAFEKEAEDLLGPNR